MKRLYLDCGMGAAGDMLAAALFELLGEEDKKRFIDTMEALSPEGVSVSIRPETKCGIVGSHFDVLINGEAEQSLDHCESAHAHTHEEGHIHTHTDGDAHTHAGGHVLAHSDGHAHTHETEHHHDGEHVHTHAEGHVHTHTDGHAHTHETEHHHDGEHVHTHAEGHIHTHADGDAHTHAGGHVHTHTDGHVHTHETEHHHDGEHVHTHAEGHVHTHTDGHVHTHAAGHHHAAGHAHAHHSMADVERIVGGFSVLSEEVRKDILDVYGMIAEAESTVHGEDVSEIHFHEVGMMDAIIDVTAVCLLMDMLAPDDVMASPVRVGKGHVRCAHGVLPVPVPAAACILRGVPIYAGNIEAELCTPTGAALLKHFVREFGDQPVMTVSGIGYGMGTKDFEICNCVRAMIDCQD